MPILEISDLIGVWDPATGERTPIVKSDVVALLREAGDRRAARIVERMPACGEFLDPGAVDHLFLRVHTELQRLGEELHMVQRFAELLAPVLAAVRSHGPGPLRVVDIGCGLGYAIRAFAASAVLGEDVELIGVDFNPVLVAEATRLAEAERLKCRFLHGDAFALAEPATVYISNGVLHHFPVSALAGFFQAQNRPDTMAFVHYDIAATRLAPLGAWVFHRARMREPLGRHDGVASAKRAHADSVLLNATARLDGMDVFLFEPMRYANPFCASMRPVVGVRPELTGELHRALGRRARGLVRDVPTGPGR
ncbi:class I SAM-dependent methyltransferase [Thermomonospora umbrina]|uniref:Methyltransferase family protein n=1 Tax=Thermomonospora umbrina TaxID=111806 RepID=A0A3D9SR93_9ACTN|nr:class I SAM-dependent methyltransferase [Thermomonospora umbrina]REE97030.1 methyltransferase family protein [Thermomonospora umbrina]